jgi:hypothetical protein
VQRKALNPSAIVSDVKGKEVSKRGLPENVRAELSRATFVKLATRLLDDVSLSRTGFCAADALDPRFIYNRLAPLSPGIELANDLVRPEARSQIRLIRVKASARPYTAFQHAGTRINMTHMAQRAVNRLAGGSFFLRYIAPYEPWDKCLRRDANVDVGLEERLFTDINNGIETGVFVFSGPGNVVPATKDTAFLVLLSQQGLATAELDAAQDIVRRCLSGPLAEDIRPNRKPHTEQLKSQDDVPAAIASLARTTNFDADAVCFYGTHEPQETWRSPSYDLPASTTLVNVRELILTEEALRWFLDQPVGLCVGHCGREPHPGRHCSGEPCAACMAVSTEAAPDAHMAEAAPHRL